MRVIPTLPRGILQRAAQVTRPLIALSSQSQRVMKVQTYRPVIHPRVTNREQLEYHTKYPAPVLKYYALVAKLS